MLSEERRELEGRRREGVGGRGVNKGTQEERKGRNRGKGKDSEGGEREERETCNRTKKRKLRGQEERGFDKGRRGRGCCSHGYTN